MRRRLVLCLLLLSAAATVGCAACPGCPGSAEEAGLPARVDAHEKPAER